MVGRTVSHYRILDRLGGGGMGVVYRAEDLRLGRQVALKFLPADLARAPQALDRFQREARAASVLNHPHICTIYDIGETDGRPFIAMELLEGQTLRERLRLADGEAVGADSARGSSPLRVAQIVDLGLQLADALEAAHAKGILHRDIKPANIFLTTRGTAKLLDFGVAKLLSEPHPADTEAPTTAGGWVTGAGVALGTVGYMSPEQVRGEALDARTDLFSLGVVLYEMATGLPPFRGATSGAVLGEILTKAPTAPVRLNPEVPPDLERLVNKLLEKDRALRYHSARDLTVDLERLRRALSSPAVATRPEQASIVVLPFENLSPDPDNAFFADGLTEELIADLSKIQALRVISRTSAMHYKGTTKPLPAIAQELNVRHVLEGSVRRAGNNLRITAQLIDAATDAHLWAEKYSGTLDDVFDLQEQLSRRIVDALRVTLTPAELGVLSARPMNNAAAYECYLRATYGADFWTPDGLARAETHLKRGLEIIGEHPAILAGLAYVNTQYVNVGLAQDEALALALAYGERALALDSASPQAHAALGSLASLQGNASKAVWHYRQAVAGAPGDLTSTAWLCWLYMFCGKMASAAPLLERLLRLDPVNPLVHLVRGAEPYFEGRFGQAAELGAVFYKMAPGQSMFVFWYALVLAYAGRGPEAEDVLATLREEPGDDAFARLGLMLKCTISGDHPGFERLMTPQFEVTARRDSQDSWHLAAFYARLGGRDLALEWLTNAVERGFANAPFIETADPFLESIRGDPRFHALVERARQIQASIEA